MSKLEQYGVRRSESLSDRARRNVKFSSDFLDVFNYTFIQLSIKLNILTSQNHGLCGNNKLLYKR